MLTNTYCLYLTVGATFATGKQNVKETMHLHCTVYTAYLEDVLAAGVHSLFNLDGTVSGTLLLRILINSVLYSNGSRQGIFTPLLPLKDGGQQSMLPLFL